MRDRKAHPDYDLTWVGSNRRTLWLFFNRSKYGQTDEEAQSLRNAQAANVLCLVHVNGFMQNKQIA